MPNIDYGYGYKYFNKNGSVIPDRTTLEISADFKTITIRADEDTCFGPTSPTMTVWSSTRGDVKGPYAMTMSADRKTLTCTYPGEDYIYRVQINNAWTYKMELAQGYTGTGRFVMRYDVDHQSYEPQFIADYGYQMHPNYSYYAYLYADYEDTTPAASVNIDMWPDKKRVGWPYELDGAWPSVWEGYKKIVMELATVSGSEPLLATITNNTLHNSYAIRSVWDSDNEVWKAVLEVAGDLYWFPRSTFQIAVNNVVKTLTYDNDFYYKHKSLTKLDVTDDIAVSGRTIVMSGEMYHRDWGYIDFGQFRNILNYQNWSNVDLLTWEALEDVVKVSCVPGYRFKQWYNSQHPEGTPLEAVWVFFVRDNTPYYLDIEPNRTYGTINLSAWETGTGHTCHSNEGGPESIPVSYVNMAYNLSHCSVQGTAPTTLAINGHLQLTLVADSGYQFDAAPTLRYYDGWDNAVYVNATVSQDKLTATFDWYPASVTLSDSYPNGHNFLVAGTAAVAPPPPFSATIVNNISGTTYTQTNDNINVYAPTGYVFSAAPTLDWTDGTNSGTANFTLAADGKSAVVNATAWRTSAYTLTIQGAIEQEHTWGPSSITNNVAHTTQSLSGTTLTLVCDNGYAFDDAPVIAQAGSAGPITMTLNTNGTIASADITAYDELAVVISGSTSLIPEPPTPSTNHTVYTRLTNCTGSGIPGVVDEDDVLSITLTANTGYEFDVNYKPALEYIKTDNLTYSEQFTIAADGLSATLTIGMAGLGLKEDSAITIVGQAYETEPTPPGPEPPYTDKYGMVNVYNPTTSELQQFAAQRFRYDQNMMPFDDLGNYVTSLKIVYVSIPATTATTIKAGRYSTNIATRTPTTDLITLDFGSILLPAHNLDILDYSSKVSLFLPFVGFVDVNPEFCGSSISLTYEINIVTGEGVAKLSRNNIVFAMYPCKPSSDMAYKSNTMMSQTLGGGEFNTMYLYGLRPYAIVKWYSTKNQHLLNNDCHRGVIGAYQGYAKFTEVTDINNGQITADEKNLLIRTLAGGVYIETNEP